jgi:hypothetical protein
LATSALAKNLLKTLVTKRLETLPPEIQKRVRAHAQQLLEKMNASTNPVTEAKR